MPINGLYNSRNASEKYSPFKEMNVFILTFWFWLVQVREFRIISKSWYAPSIKFQVLHLLFPEKEKQAIGFSYYILVSFWVCIPRQSLGTREVNSRLDPSSDPSFTKKYIFPNILKKLGLVLTSADRKPQIIFLYGKTGRLYGIVIHYGYTSRDIIFKGSIRDI